MNASTDTWNGHGSRREEEGHRRPPDPAATGYRLEAGCRLSVGRIAEKLEHLTFPSLRQRLQTQRWKAPVHAVALSCNGEPVGLALAHGSGDKKTSEIFSLYIRRDHRGRGLSRPLLSGMEGHLATQGFQKVQLAYRSDWPARRIIERRLAQLGWTPSVTNLSLGKFNALKAASLWRTSPLANIQLPPGFEVAPWSEQTGGELTSVAAGATVEYPGELAPLEDPAWIEPLTSLVIRYRRKVVGWLLTHRLDAHTIQYTRLHIDPPFVRLGRGLALIAEAVQRHVESGVPSGVFQVRSDNQRMLRLIERRLLPFLVTCTESRRSEKMLPEISNPPEQSRSAARGTLSPAPGNHQY